MLIFLLRKDEIKYGDGKMKVGEVLQNQTIVNNFRMLHDTVIKPDEIKSILYLGIRGEIKLGDVKLASEKEHSIDVFA